MQVIYVVEAKDEVKGNIAGKLPINSGGKIAGGGYSNLGTNVTRKVVNNIGKKVTENKAAK